MRPELDFGKPRSVLLLTPVELDEAQAFFERGEGQIPRNVVLSMIAELRTRRMQDALESSLRMSADHPGYGAAEAIGDMALSDEAEARCRTWLAAQLHEAGLVEDVKPCRVVRRGAGGASVWCGAPGLSTTRAIVVYWTAETASARCESYGGGKIYEGVQGVDVVSAVRALLALPKRGGVPLAFMRPVLSLVSSPSE